ncbi:MAG: peptidylprolyl isomerase [Bilophila sp.]
MHSLRIAVCALALFLGAGLALPCASHAAPPKVKIETSMGDIVVELNSAKAPKTVSNFVYYVKSGFYKDTIFHRVINGFMIQGGGHTADMREKDTTKKPVVNEAANGLKNEPYTIAMARTNDPDSATAQFFINVANNDFLNHKNTTPSGYGYAVFGKVIQGQDVVDRIKAVPTGNVGPYQDVPTTPVIIKNIVPVQ